MRSRLNNLENDRNIDDHKSLLYQAWPILGVAKGGVKGLYIAFVNKHM
jgi:hypothetical protein